VHPYLTNSAGWLLVTLLTEVYGIKGYFGDLAVEPKLCMEQFDKNGEASAATVFAGRKLKIIYKNKANLEYGSYKVESVRIDGKEFEYSVKDGLIIIPREAILWLDGSSTHKIEIELG
jgi:cellobiose phosphorylase